MAKGRSEHRRRRRPRKWQKPRYALRLTGLAMMLTAFGLLARHGEAPPSLSVHAQDNAGEDNAGEKDVVPPPVGHLVPVSLPIAGNSDQSVRTQITRILEKQQERGDERPPVIVLEFGQSEEQTGAGSEFGRAYELARYLLREDLRTARTVAYIPHRLEGHALLVAMACQEIVMHEDAELGRAGEEGENVGNVEREAYKDVYSQRQTLPAALAVGMIDPQVEVYRASVKDGSRWIYAEQLPEVQDEAGFTGYETVVKRGDLGNFTAEELRSKYGIVSRVVADRADLAASLNLSELSDDPARAGEWNAIRVDLRGGISEKLATESIKAIRERVRAADAAGEPVNFLCVWINSPGGSSADTISLIEEIEGLRRDGIYVAAYIPLLARADAAAIAMACDSISIDPAATLGGSGAAVLDENETSDLVDRIRVLAKERGTRWSLWAAMVDRSLQVHKYTRKGTGQTAYFCSEELEQLRDADQWERGELLSDEGSLLKLDGSQAVEFGLADHAVDSYAAFQQQFGLESEPELVQRNWAHLLIESLKDNCCLPYLLLFIGCSAFLTEISAPGVGLPGFVAFVCFLLYFWLAFLKGDATSLEVLLFLAGVACIAAEIVVLPGFGVFGLGGGAMVIVSIVLASQTWVIPRNEYQLEQLPYSLMTILAAGAGVFVGVLIMRRYADRAPGLRAVMLAPPNEEELQDVSRREALADYAHLKGKRGTAATQLTPSGKARFGDDLVNVMTDGSVVDKGADVIVVGVQGNMILVEPVE